MLILYLIFSALSIEDNTQGEMTGKSLDEELEDVNRVIITPNSSYSDTEIYINDLYDVLDLMVCSEPVSIHEQQYDCEGLNSYIQGLEQQAQESKHQEELNYAVLNCISSLGNGNSSAEYLNYALALESLYEVMEEDDVASIKGVEFNKASILIEIEKANNTASNLQNQEKLQAAIENLINAGKDLETSDELMNLADRYGDLLNVMNEEGLNNVTISGKNYKIKQIQAFAERVKYDSMIAEGKEELQEVLSNYSQVLEKETGQNGEVYKSNDLVGQEIKLLEEMVMSMSEYQLVAIGLNELDKYQISDKISVLKVLQDKLKKDNVVLVINEGLYSYISQSDYEHLMEIQTIVDQIEKLEGEDEKTPDEYESLINSIKELTDILSSSETVTISGASVDKNQLVTLQTISETEYNDSKHLEKLNELSQELSGELTSAGTFFTKSELEKISSTLNELNSALNPDEEVTINNQIYSSSVISVQQSSISDILKNSDSDDFLAILSPDNTFKVIDTPSLDNSGTLSSEDYEDLVKASPLYSEDAPIISTNSEVDSLTLQNSDLQVTLKTKPSSFIETKSLVLTEGQDYHEGTANLMIVTTMTDSGGNTGKVYVLNLNDPTDYYQLMAGLDKPTSVCVDVNNGFLYVVDMGSGSIVQYQVEFNGLQISFLGTSAYTIYTGTPYDCKVDYYGNLYFTEFQQGFIGKIQFSDLFYGYGNTFMQLYTGKFFDGPTGIEIYEGKDIYFVNENSNTESGTLDHGYTQEGTQINIIAQETDGALGVGISGNNVYYSLSSGDIKKYTIGESSSLFSSGFGSPRGISSSSGVIYVADYGTGSLIYIDESEPTEIQVLAYIQGVASCFAVNQVVLSYSMAISVSVLLFLVS